MRHISWLQRCHRYPNHPKNVSRTCRVRTAQEELALPPTMTDLDAGPASAPVMTYKPVISWDPEVEAYLSACLGAEQLQRVSEALTRPPLATCLRVNTLRVTPQELLECLPAALFPEDRALLESNPRKPFIHPQLPNAIIVPGTGPHEIDYSCTGGKEVVVGRLAGEAMMRGAHLFAPGTLAVSTGIARGDLVAVSVGVEVPGNSRNKWGMNKGTVLGIDPEKDAQLPDRSRLYIGIGRAEMSRVEMFRNGSGLAVSMQERVFRTVGCGDILRGQFMLQNLPSLVAATVLGAHPGARVLDMCAAPGGKTTAIAQLMNNQGEVIALDRTHSKARGIRELADELGITIVKAYKMNAAFAVLRKGKGKGKNRGSAAGAEADAVAGQVGAGEEEPGPSGAQPGRDEGSCKAAKAHVAAREGGSNSAAEAAEAKGAAATSGSGSGRAAQGSGGSGGGDGSAAGGGSGEPGGEISERMRRRLDRIAAARKARGLDPGVSPHLPEGKEATLEGFEPESFDYVLLDAPCSALGLRPRLTHHQTLKDLEGTATYQRLLLDAAVRLVKPGGMLVFSTCSINPGENEANVRYTLDTYPCMRLVPATPILGGPGLSGEVTLSSGGTLRMLSAEEAPMVQRFDPSAPLDTIGFFVSKFVKTESYYKGR